MKFTRIYFKDSALAAWLLSEPRTDTMWYDKLSQTSDTDGILKDLNVASSSFKDGSCVAINRFPNSPQTLSITAEDCNEKKLAICRIKPPIASNPKKQTSLSCLEESKGRWLLFYSC